MKEGDYPAAKPGCIYPSRVRWFWTREQVYIGGEHSGERWWEPQHIIDIEDSQGCMDLRRLAQGEHLKERLFI